MAWNPQKYNKFKTERFAPFYDLQALIEVKTGIEVIDLGCGTGELTGKLADYLPDAQVTGIDSSAEMLNDASAFSRQNLQFKQTTIEDQLNTGQKWDLVFSNAAIQWVEDHETLLPRIIQTIKPQGQLAIQIPAQNTNALNQILFELAQEQPYSNSLKDWKRISPVLGTHDYAQLLFENGSKSMTVYEKIYPLVAADTNELFEWISGTALIPYLERLQGKIKEDFLAEFKKRIDQRFPKKPVLYPFKRIIIEAKF